MFKNLFDCFKTLVVPAAYLRRLGQPQELRLFEHQRLVMFLSTRLDLRNKEMEINSVFHCKGFHFSSNL